MTGKQKTWLALASVVLLVAIACITLYSHNRALSASRQAVPPWTVLVFGDRSEAKYEYVFVLGSHSAVAQRHVFPGYTNKTFFACQELPASLREKAREWGLRKGSAAPFFEPPGVWYYMEALPPRSLGTARPTEYFGNDDSRFREWMLELRKELAVETRRVDQLPSWVAEYPYIMRLLGRTAVAK